MRISSESAAALELESLLRLVAECASTDVGRERVLALEPLSSTGPLERAIARGRETERLLEDGALVAARDEPLLPLLERLSSGGVAIDGMDLLGIRDLVRATASAALRIESSDPACPHLARLVSRLPDLSPLEKSLGRALDGRGRVRDEASPRLAKLRRQSQRLRQSTYKKLETYARKHSDELAEDTVPLHEDRLVVLLRAGSKGRLPGLVHGKSGSGQSFYFEPLDVVDANNELRAANAEEEAERRRILNALIEQAIGELDSLGEHLEFLAELDSRQAAVRWGRAVEGNWVEPTEGQPCVLVDARHPLLDPRLTTLRERALGQAGHDGEIVPLSVELVDGARLLIITGPNAGGKTVALKTLGLIVLGAHCGLPVPARLGTTVPLLDGVVASVGDEQDLLADRSTFSGRLLRLEETWESAGPRTLILIDELGSGTDPEEGAALGVSLVEELLARDSLAAISSHLTRLAAAALELDGAACAAMAYDTESGTPTYRLLPGIPGGSEALSLARRMNLPDRWIDRAEELLGPEHGQLQRLLSDIEHTRKQLASELSRAAEANRQLESERREVEQERSDLEAERERAAEDARRAVGEMRRKVRKRLGEEVERLKSEVEQGRRRGLAAEGTERIFEDAPVAERKRSGQPVEAGSRVRHLGLGWEGVVGKLEGKRAEVVVKGKRFVCLIDELDAVEGSREERTARPRGVTFSTSGSEAPPPKELHLRGERVESALEKLDAYLDQALLAGMPEARVVHGHGSGQLKKAVREALDRHRGVAKWRPGGRGEGGDGATVVDLAD